MKENSANQRLLSIDALRGFDMFWIMSGEHIIHALAKATHLSVFEWMSEQLDHAAWNGITFYDTIFPLFLFIAGLSMPFALQKNMTHEGVLSAHLLPNHVKKVLYRSMLKRTLTLIVLGFIVNGLFSWSGYENTRFASVLGRIGLASFLGGMIYLNCDTQKQIYWFVGLLIGYCLAMLFIPVPNIGAGVITPEGSLETYIDGLFLPGKFYAKVYDPEGIMSTFPAIGTALLGIFTGTFVKNIKTISSYKKVGILLLAGVALLGIGLLWNTFFPINKNLWTSSFVCFVGGYSVLMFALFHLIIDLWGLKKWTFPFVIIGMNSILIYVATSGMVDFGYTADFLFGGLIQQVSLSWQPVFKACAITFTQLMGLYILYRKKIFLKV